MKYAQIAASLLGAGIVLVSVSAWATEITVTNPSFETPVATGSDDAYNGGSGSYGCLGSAGDSTISCTTGGGSAPYTTTAITSWTIAGAALGGEGDAGVFGPTSSDFSAASDSIGSIVPNGSQAAYLNSSSGPTSVTQILTGTLIGNNTTYALTVYAGHDLLYSDWPDEGVTIDLLGNGSVIATDDVTDPGLGKWALETLDYTGTLSTAGETLGIEITADDTQDPAMFDDVTLCTNGSCSTGKVPEPSSLAILGTALIGLGFISFRRRRKDAA